jgi:hypothetical protein
LLRFGNRHLAVEVCGHSFETLRDAGFAEQRDLLFRGER